MKRRSTHLIISLTLLLSVRGWAAQSSELPPEAEGPYCGVETVYAALKLAGKEVRFTDLLTRRYVSSREGSSLGDLESALSDHGLYALALSGITADTLLQSHYPVILHVQSSALQYDHFVLYLGCSDGKAVVYDHSAGIKRIPLLGLSFTTDGNGMAVAAHRISRFDYLWPAIERVAEWIGTAFVGSILVYLMVQVGAAAAATAKTIWRTFAEQRSVRCRRRECLRLSC